MPTSEYDSKGTKTLNDHLQEMFAPAHPDLAASFQKELKVRGFEILALGTAPQKGRRAQATKR